MSLCPATLGAPQPKEHVMAYSVKPRPSRIDPDHLVFAVGLVALATSLLVTLASA